MASKSKVIKYHVDDEDNDIWSTSKCIFCNVQLDGASKMLECLHIACNNCILEKKTDSGVQCICKTVSKSQLPEYTIIPPKTEKIELCSENNCNEISTKICLHCKKLYCRPCSKEHLRNNKDHKPDTIKAYPIETALCTSCEKKYAEVYCPQCSVIICGLCHLSSHKTHEYQVLEKTVSKMKTNLNEKFCDLKKNDNYLRFCLDQNNKQISNIEINMKKMINEEINLKMDMLLEKLNERELELRNLVEKEFSDSITKLKQNEQFVNKIKKQNQYELNLIKAVSEHNNPGEIMDLSQLVLDKLKCPSRQILPAVHNIRFQTDIKLICDETFEKCVSSIRAINPFSVLDITTSSPSQNVSEVGVDLPINESQTENIQSANSEDKTNFDAASQLLIECICCKQGNEILIKCNVCNRNFHNDCHIPTVPQNVELPKNWKCTLCRDITKYSNWLLNLHEMNTADHVPIHKFELKIVERILLELYCQNVCDNRFRKSLIKGIYPVFYDKMFSCISLDDVKTRLKSYYYSSLFHFLKDLKQIFINALLYYPPSDPHYLAAFELQTTFNSMITKWLPKFDQTKLAQL